MSDAWNKQHHDPLEETEGSYSHHYHQPEPQQQQQHLVVEVHRQGALNGVLVVVAYHPLHHVAVRHSGEAVRRRPSLSVHHPIHHPEAVVVEIVAEECIQVVQLTYGVGQVSTLDHQVHYRQTPAPEETSQCTGA